MSAPPEAQGAPITDRRQLVAYLEAGCKPKVDWRIGTEHEKFGYTHGDLRPLAYEGERSVRALLEGLAARFDWRVISEQGRP
ncbi:MAG: glutamate--cysteine ligase, partial [Geminicoccales bacterium]